MMMKKKQIKKESGFTLLEVIISISIIVVIMGIVLASLRLSIDAWQKGEARIEEFQKLRFIVKKLSEDISSLNHYYPIIDLSDEENLSGFEAINRNATFLEVGENPKKRFFTFEGEADSLHFISTTMPLFNQNRLIPIKDVNFSLSDAGEEDGVERKTLSYSESFLNPVGGAGGDGGLEDGGGLEIIDNVYSLEFSYHIISRNVVEKKETIKGWFDRYVPAERAEEEETAETINEIEFIDKIKVAVTLVSDEIDEDGEQKLIPLPDIIVPVHTGKIVGMNLMESDES